MLNETLRWFPPVVDIPKESAEDTSFALTNAKGERATVPIPRGACVTLSVPALHHNRASPLSSLSSSYTLSYHHSSG